jgi:hypothetical protein
LPARAAVTTDVAEVATVFINHFDGPTQLFGDLFIEQTTSLDPVVDPNSLFPIVIDPNDPPDPPASLATTSRRVRGQLSGCGEFLDQFNQLVFRCFGGGIDQPMAEGDLTFDAVPLPGNAFTFSMSVTVAGPFGDPLVFDIDGAFAEPRNTGLGACPGCANVNPWMNEGRVHVDLDHYEALISRTGYQGGVAIDAPGFLDEFITNGTSANYSLQRRTHADAEI